MANAFIYVLKNPIDDEVCYVGKTIAPQRRLNGHISSGKYRRTSVEKWIYDLACQGHAPIMTIIEECTEDNINERERFWIDDLSESYILLNSINHAGAGKVKNNESRDWISVKIWQQTRQTAKVMAAHRNMSFASIIDEAMRALKEIRRKHGPDWEDVLLQERRDDNFFDEEYS